MSWLYELDKDTGIISKSEGKITFKKGSNLLPDKYWFCKKGGTHQGFLVSGDPPKPGIVRDRCVLLAVEDDEKAIQAIRESYEKDIRKTMARVERWRTLASQLRIAEDAEPEMPDFAEEYLTDDELV